MIKMTQNMLWFQMLYYINGGVHLMLQYLRSDFTNWPTVVFSHVLTTKVLISGSVVGSANAIV